MINLIDDINKHMKKAAKETEWKKRYTLGNGNWEAKQDMDALPPNLHSHTHTHQLSIAFTLFLEANASTRRNYDC